jgi:nuclear transport factor 2 (NTF2) superfamily protein
MLTLNTTFDSNSSNIRFKELIECYLKNEIEQRCIQEVFCIGKTRFLVHIEEYHKNSNDFFIQYTRKAKAEWFPKAFKITL